MGRNNKKQTNEQIDERLIGTEIKRIDDYINSQTKIMFQCDIKICSYLWLAKPDHILNSKSKCPNCNNRRKLTNKDIDNRLIGRNIRRLEDFTTVDARMKWECEICLHSWETTPNHLFGKHATNCSKCQKTLKLTNEEVDKRLEGREIKRIGEYINNETKIMWGCLKEDCLNKWMATPAHVISGNLTGCRFCSLNKNEKLINRMFKNNNFNYISQQWIRDINYSDLNLRVDFYFSNLKLIIEYDGAQHFGPIRFYTMSKEQAEANFIKQQLRDNYLEQFCKDNNIKLIRIDGRKYYGRKLEKYIKEIILPMIQQ